MTNRQTQSQRSSDWPAARSSYTAFLFAAGLAALMSSVSAQPAAQQIIPVIFDDYFTDKALRLEFFQCGNSSEVSLTLHEMFEEPMWPENPAGLISPFSYGRFQLRVFDAETGRMICSKGFDTMYAEYATTEPARKGIKRVFEFVVRCPFPKKPIRVAIERRDAKDYLAAVFETTIDPADYHIRRETIPPQDQTFDLRNTGPPAERVDVVFLAEGYTSDEFEKLRADVQRMTEFMFSQAPYKDLNDRFNIRGVFRPSAEQGTDEPRQRSFRSTVLNSTYNIFETDRYLLLEDNHAMHRMAAQVPYDTIVVLVNTQRYGGGSICLDYCTSSVDHVTSPLVFLHEFGHSFAYLADEYIGNVAYSELYPEGIEPTEPNITREIHRDRIKWKSHLTPDVALPTPDLQESKRLVGAFEGGGYLSKGMYRPEQSCWMGDVDPQAGFCVVCADSIRRMVEFHSNPGLKVERQEN